MRGDDRGEGLGQRAHAEGHVVGHLVNNAPFQDLIGQHHLLRKAAGDVGEDAHHADVVAQVVHAVAAIPAMPAVDVGCNGQLIADLAEYSFNSLIGILWI